MRRPQRRRAAPLPSSFAIDQSTAAATVVLCTRHLGRAVTRGGTSLLMSVWRFCDNLSLFVRRRHRNRRIGLQHTRACQRRASSQQTSAAALYTLGGLHHHVHDLAATRAGPVPKRVRRGGLGGPAGPCPPTAFPASDGAGQRRAGHSTGCGGYGARPQRQSDLGTWDTLHGERVGVPAAAAALRAAAQRRREGQRRGAARLLLAGHRQRLDEPAALAGAAARCGACAGAPVAARRRRVRLPRRSPVPPGPSDACCAQGPERLRREAAPGAAARFRVANAGRGLAARPAVERPGQPDPPASGAALRGSQQAAGAPAHPRRRAEGDGRRRRRREGCALRRLAERGSGRRAAPGGLAQ